MAKKTRKAAPKVAPVSRPEARDWYKIGASAFALWALVNTFLLATRYGVLQGGYWWFGNLVMVATAWGLYRKDRAWLTAALSLCCITEGFWLVDQASRLFLGRHWLGVTSFLYTPGLRMDEFVLAHGHYFALPVCFFALYFTGKKASQAMRLVYIATPVVLLVSFFAFPAARNVNCVRESCIAAFKGWSGIPYSLLFSALIIGAHLTLTQGFETLFSGMKRTAQRRKLLVQAFAGLVAVFTALSLYDFKYKLSLPRLACAPAMENGMVKIGCDYTTEVAPGAMIFAYHVQNKTGGSLSCKTRAKTQFNEFVLNDRMVLAPGENKKVGQVLPFPDVSVDVELSALCEAAPDRAVASEKPVDNYRIDYR